MGPVLRPTLVGIKSFDPQERRGPGPSLSTGVSVTFVVKDRGPGRGSNGLLFWTRTIH